MPPIIYLVLNEMIRNDVREMIVGFVAVNLRLLSPETRVEIEHVSHMGPDEKGDGDDEVCNDGNNQQQRQQQQASEIVEMRPVGSDRQPPTDAAFSGQLALPRTPVFMTKRFLPMVQQRRNGRRSNKAREEMQKLHRVKFSAKLNKFVLS
jgi:hypothetical protein